MYSAITSNLPNLIPANFSSHTVCTIHGSEISQLFLHLYVPFHLTQLFICGNIWYLFPILCNWQICHTHWAFKQPLHTFSGNLQTIPMVKSKMIGFSLVRTQQYTLVSFWWIPHRLLLWELLSDHYVAFSEVAATWYTNQCMWLYWSAFENCSSMPNFVSTPLTWSLIVSTWIPTIMRGSKLSVEQ